MRRPQKLRTLRRSYAWIDGQAWRITHELHSKFVAGEVALPRFANMHLRIIGVLAARRAGREPILQVSGSTYILDKHGHLNLSDQADAAQEIVGAKLIGKNVVNIQTLIGAKRWRNIHNWEPPSAAIRQIEADVFPEKRTGKFRSAPVLPASSPRS